MVLDSVHRRLLAVAPGSIEPRPDLAETLPEVSADGRTVTVRLRRGVRFSEPVDREVTSADVKYAIERGFTDEVANGYAGLYFGDLTGAQAFQEGEADEIEGLQTPDDRTLVLRLDAPTGGVVVGAMVLPLTAPVPREYAERFDRESPSTYARHQVATGPYRLPAAEDGTVTGYDPGRRIRLERNLAWEADTDVRPAYLDRIEIRQGNSDTTVASRRVLNGQGLVNGDFAPDAPVLRQALEQAPDQVELTPSGGLRMVTLNTSAAPFDDLDVRRAVVAGFDREAMRLARGGEVLGDLATHFIPPDVPGFDEAGGVRGPDDDALAAPGGDLDRAGEHLRAAGFASGRFEGEEVRMVGVSGGVDQQAAEVAEAQLERLGFDVRLQLYSSDTVLSRFCTVPAAEIAVCPNLAWGRDFNDAQTILQPLFDGDAIQPEGNANWSQLDDPEVNAAIDAARLLSDPDERAAAWGAVDRMIVALAPAVPVVWDRQPNVRSADVLGAVNPASAKWDLAYMSRR
jgi:peptide/nickel transport system substrate-binding protein